MILLESAMTLIFPLGTQKRIPVLSFFGSGGVNAQSQAQVAGSTVALQPGGGHAAGSSEGLGLRSWG